MNGLDRDTFIMKHEGLIREIAKKFLCRINYYPHIEFDDLVQTGYIGLIKAYNNFKPEYGTQFSTYAVPMIEGEIKRYLRDNLELIKYSRQTKLDFSQINKAGLVNEKPEIIASQLKMPVERVKNALAYYQSHRPDSIQLVIHDEDSTPLTLEDKLGEEVDFDTKLELEFFLKQLDERTRKIVEMRLRGLTQEQIAEEIGISQVQISRILHDLRKRMKKGGGLELITEETKYTKARELAEKTTLSAKEIQRETGVSYTTALNYIREYRPGYVQKTVKSKTVKQQTNKKQTNKSDIKKRLDVPEINKPSETNSNGYVTMTFKLSMVEAQEKLGEIMAALKTLGFENINITLESQKIA